MGLMQRGMAMLNRVMGQTAGVAITYARALESVAITVESGGAWVGLSDDRSVRNEGTRVEFSDRDYLVTVEAIAELGEPQEGDRITETINGVVCLFEVRPTDVGPAWEWSNAERTRYRIHTKQVS